MAPAEAPNSRNGSPLTTADASSSDAERSGPLQGFRLAPVWCFVLLLPFALLFSLYDLSVLLANARAPHGASLLNYEVRDGKIDESLMYMPAIRKKADGAWGCTDPYIKEHRDLLEIRPCLPAWIGCALYWTGGGINGCVLLLHAVLPAAGGVLLVRFFRTFVSAGLAFGLALIGVGGACYAINWYLTSLHLLPLGISEYFPYCPEKCVLLGEGMLHLQANRFMSPGVTLPWLLVALCALGQDPDVRRPRRAVVLGLLWGLQLYIYPHGFAFLGMLLAVLLLLNLGAALSKTADGPRGPAVRQSVRAALLIGLSAAVVAIPFGVSLLTFRATPNAGDVLLRAGYSDDLWATMHAPVYLWVALAVWLKTLANRAEGRRAWSMTATPQDRLWLALVVVSSLGTWLASALASIRLFVAPWLIPLRITSFLVPVVVAWPLVVWAKNDWSPAARRWATRVVTAGLVLYAALLVGGEVVSGVHNAPLYRLTDSMCAFREAVEGQTESEATVMTDDLKLAALLVNATDRYSYIGYGIMSNASNEELLERLMVPCVLGGKTFDEFYGQHYRKGFGLPNGPAGDYWVWHMGMMTIDVDREFLAAKYSELVALRAQELLSRYACDYVYLAADEVEPRYRELLEPTGCPNLFHAKIMRQ